MIFRVPERFGCNQYTALSVLQQAHPPAARARRDALIERLLRGYREVTERLRRPRGVRGRSPGARTKTPTRRSLQQRQTPWLQQAARGCSGQDPCRLNAVSKIRLPSSRSPFACRPNGPCADSLQGPHITAQSHSQPRLRTCVPDAAYTAFAASIAACA